MSKADEARRVAIERRLNTKYPDLDVTVTIDGHRKVTIDPVSDREDGMHPGFTVIIRSDALRTGFAEHFPLDATVANVVLGIRRYADDMASDHAAHLDSAPVVETPDDRRRRIERARARARVLVSGGQENGNVVRHGARELEPVLALFGGLPRMSRLTGPQYVKLVDILHGHVVARGKVVDALLAAGLVVEVGAHLEVADADAYDAAIREHEDYAMARMPRITSGPAPARPDMSGYPTTAEFMASTRARLTLAEEFPGRTDVRGVEAAQESGYD